MVVSRESLVPDPTARHHTMDGQPAGARNTPENGSDVNSSFQKPPAAMSEIVGPVLPVLERVVRYKYTPYSQHYKYSAPY